MNNLKEFIKSDMEVRGKEQTFSSFLKLYLRENISLHGLD